MNGPCSPDRAIGRIFEQAQGGTVLALPPIAQALDASYSLLFRTDRQRGVVEDASCCGVDGSYVDRLKDAARERLLPGWLGGLLPGSVRDRAAFGTDQEFARTPFYNHVIRPEGRFHCLIATPFVSDRLRFHLIVGRPRSHEEFNGGDQRLLTAFLPYVSEILRLRADLVEARSLAQHTVDLLGGRHGPVMIASADGALLFANQAARRGFAAGQGLRVDQASRSLICDSAADTGRFRRALRAAASGSGAQAVTLPFGVSATAQVTVRRCAETEDRASDPGAPHPHLIVRVDDPSDLDDHERAAGIARDHGLTHREEELLALIVGGETLQTAASRLGMTYNTARTHLRQIFGKLDLHRQSDLLRFCATGRRPGQ